ncbi:MAG: hypothetical protein FWG04_01655 [Desulfovibrionaceae bacterium]|nr:hypothetical protein [Desulfovibrionaceae bacterium]
MDVELLYTKLLLPLLRLAGVMCIGLLLASLLESLHWTRFVAKLAAPLARAGHLHETSAASFALAFFSPAASNALLAEAHARGEMTRGELMFANLFNSSPTFLVHLPTLFSLVFAFLGPLAFVYVGLCFAAAALRTVCTLVAGRLMLPEPKARRIGCEERGAEQARDWRKTVDITWGRFRKRIVKLLIFTVPIYVFFFALQQAGAFRAAERWMADHSGWLAFLNPKSLSIVAMSLLSESGAALSAAAALADAGALAPREIVMALLVGNIISTPMRAVRHQFPSYAGFFSPALALPLVLANQACRAASLVAVTAVYYWYAF